ncbi:MAG TPA: glycosyltransferase [Pseudomonadales bacterium]
MDVSVIVPVYDHWDLVPRLLERLRAQSLSQDRFEVLLVDNGSTQFSPPDELPGNVRILTCSTPGSYAARNAAIEAARGAWLVFTDADCLPRSDWLERLLHEAERSPNEPILIAGRVDVVASSSAPNRYEMYDIVKGIPQSWYVARGYAATANLAAPAQVVRELNGFDASRFSGGDYDFCRRASRAGVGLRYADDAVVEHPARKSWQALVVKARRIKGAHIRAGSIRRRLMWMVRTFTPPVIAMWRFLSSPGVPMRYRLAAVTVQLRIWGVEMVEAVRLLGRKVPERR